MSDLYGRWVPNEWIEKVHQAMLDSPQWQYILLTKFPRRYLEVSLPPNAWVGASVDTQSRVKLTEDTFRELKGVAVRWLSLEPLLEPLEFQDLSVFD
jgi:protein gp37